VTSSQAKHRTIAALLSVFFVLGTVAAASAQVQPLPPTDLTATDHRWDDGTRIDLTWSLSADDATVESYIIRRRTTTEDRFTVVDLVPAGTSRYTVGGLNPSQSYLFQITAGAGTAASQPVESTTPITPTMEWFDGTRGWFLLTLLIFCGSVVAYIALARRGVTLTVRKIAGLEAVDEAVGRATEMGRSCLFVPGVQDMNELQTIAGLNVLARVAKTAAEYDARIEVPTSKSLVMTAARETVEASYLGAGRPDTYNADNIYYVTDEQFGYVAYLQGMMVRDKPAACFYMGSFFAESLILAETGNSIGAIQIAGTAQPAQLPFFVAACDYTLIGEEFFAASAYLSGQPDQLGSLKGQDIGKLIVGAGIVTGVMGITIAEITGWPWLASMVRFFTDTMLT
jgi:hypothetical protein